MLRVLIFLVALPTLVSACVALCSTDPIVQTAGVVVAGAITTAAEAASTLSEYEQERLQNIEDNNARLRELGLAPPNPPPKKNKARADKRKPSRSPQPPRRSTRLDQGSIVATAASAASTTTARVAQQCRANPTIGAVNQSASIAAASWDEETPAQTSDASDASRGELLTCESYADYAAYIKERPGTHIFEEELRTQVGLFIRGVSADDPSRRRGTGHWGVNCNTFGIQKEKVFNPARSRMANGYIFYGQQTAQRREEVAPQRNGSTQLFAWFHGSMYKALFEPEAYTITVSTSDGEQLGEFDTFGGAYVACMSHKSPRNDGQRHTASSESHKKGWWRDDNGVIYDCRSFPPPKLSARRREVTPQSEARRKQIREAKTKSRQDRVEKAWCVDLGLDVLPPEIKAVVRVRVQREAIVRDKMSPDDVTEDHLPGGWIADAVNDTSGWFTEFKLLSRHASLTAARQVQTYRNRIREKYGRVFKSRIVFFSEDNEVDAIQRFDDILVDYYKEPFGLTEAVLMHASNFNVVEHSVVLKELKRVKFEEPKI